MKTTPIEIITLQADKGKILTNGEIYSTQVYLGINDSPNNWWEIPIEEMPAEQEGQGL